MTDFRSKEDKQEAIGKAAAEIVAKLIIDPVVAWLAWKYIIASTFDLPVFTLWQVWMLIMVWRMVKGNPK